MPLDFDSSSCICRRCGTVAVCLISSAPSAHSTGQSVPPPRAKSPSPVRDEEYRFPESLTMGQQYMPRTKKGRRPASQRRIIKRIPSLLLCSAISLSGGSLVSSASVQTSRRDRAGGLFQWVEFDGEENFDWTKMSLPYDKRDLDPRGGPDCGQQLNKDECNAHVSCWWGGNDGLGTCIDLTPPQTQDEWGSPSPSIVPYDKRELDPSGGPDCGQQTNEDECNAQINCLWGGDDSLGTCIDLSPSLTQDEFSPSPSIAATPSLTGTCSEQTNNSDCRMLSNCLWSGSCLEKTVSNTGVPTPAPTDTPTGVYTLRPITDPPTRKPTLPPTVSPTTDSPTRKPTLPPTVSPTTGSPTTSQPTTDKPTKEPSLSPSKRPTEEPSLSPSKRPTEEPSLSPSKRPTEEPSLSPSKRPTPMPSNAPSWTPTYAPTTERPTGEPSTFPSKPPSENPSTSPTASSRPTPLVWPSASPTSSAYPTASPSAFPTWSPSESPSLAPSARPTTKPTKSPHVDVSGQPFALPIRTDPPVSSTPTSRPTAPNFQISSYDVPTTMTLGPLTTVWNNQDEQHWEKRTVVHIWKHSLQIIQSEDDRETLLVGEDGNGLTVSIKELIARPLQSDRRLQRGTVNGDHYGIRGLQPIAPTQYEIDFIARIEFASSKTDWNADEMVASGFVTPTQQREYISTLRDGDRTGFDQVSSMTMDVDGQRITEEEEVTSSPNIPANQNNMMYIVAGCVGGLLVILAMLGLVYWKRKRNQERSRTEFPKNTSPRKFNSLAHQSQSGRPQDKSAVPSSPQQQECFGVIEPKPEEMDDVSTIGDPYFGEGVAFEPKADETVADSLLSSEQELYVYGVGRPRLNTGRSTVTGGTNPGGNKLYFGEDSTLEDAYRAPERSGDMDKFQRVCVVAPPGKLGIVIDNPRTEVPFVHAIKETSILFGRVNVGDFLVSVDEVDCKGLTAIQVSRLISSRNQNPRNLVMLRSLQGMDGSGASAV